MGKYDDVEIPNVPLKEMTPLQKKAYGNKKAIEYYARKTGKMPPFVKTNKKSWHNPRVKASNKAYHKVYDMLPAQKQKQKEWRERTNFSFYDYLRAYRRRFDKMKENDPTMKDMDDIALKYLASELMDPDTDKARKDQIAFKLLPFTSRAKPTMIEAAVEVTAEVLDTTPVLKLAADLLKKEEARKQLEQDVVSDQ